LAQPALTRALSSGTKNIVTRQWENGLDLQWPGLCETRTRTIGPHRRIHNEAQPVLYDPGSGCRIEFPIALLNPPRADMALHRDADMVWAIVGTGRVKFLSGFASGHGKDTLAQA
jgi:hypothetical protein